MVWIIIIRVLVFDKFSSMKPSAACVLWNPLILNRIDWHYTAAKSRARKSAEILTFICCTYKFSK